MRSLCCLLVVAWPLTQALAQGCSDNTKLNPPYKTSIWRPDPSKKHEKGIEYNEMSRSSLLRVLAEFAQSVEDRLRGRKLHPQLTAQFDNNKYTRPFIYPQFFKTNLMNKSIGFAAEDPGLCTQTGIRQVIYAMCASSVELSIGMAYGFGAVMHPQIMASASMHITESQGAWLVSIIYLFLPLGNLLNGMFMDKFGRRIAMTIGTIPLFAGWLCTGLAGDSVLNIIIGRAITGFGCGMATGPPRVFIAEISLPNLRGVLGAFSPITTSLGITTQATLGALLHWDTVCFVCAGYTVFVFILTLFIPETPYYLMKKFRPTEQIEKSLRKFRGNNYNLEMELDAMEDFQTSNAVKRLSACGEIKALFKMSVCRPFTIVLSYILTAQMTGIAILVQWTVEILNESRISVNSNVGNIAMSGLRFLTLILMAFLIYHIPRRVLALISSLGVGVSSLVVYFHLLYSTETHFYPMLMYLLYTFFSTLGFYCLPFIIMTEIYPLQVRGLLGGLTLATTNVESFLFTKLYPNVHDAIGLTTLFLIFSISAFVGSVFLYFVLPETKGLTLQEIEEFYTKRRPTLVASRDVRSAQQLAMHSMQQLHTSRSQLNF